MEEKDQKLDSNMSFMLCSFIITFNDWFDSNCSSTTYLLARSIEENDNNKTSS